MGAVTWLLESDEPAFRYLTRRWLLGQAKTSKAVRRERERIADGPMVRALLAFPGREVHPYRKWTGAHWRLVSLADLNLPAGHPAAEAALDRVLDWLTGIQRRAAIKPVNGLVRSHASIDGNGLYAASRLGHATDERARLLATSLAEWQWPDGGWNCDVEASGRRSSFHESWVPMLALAAYHRATGDRDALAVARRGAELLLEHRLFRSLRTGKPIHASFVGLHWPAYWHYDVLAGLRALQALDRLTDERATDALDLLESRRLPDGRFRPGQSWWQPTGTRTRDVVDWGRGGPSRLLTLHVLAVLKAAGRIQPA
jgi:hypothetical protein